MLDACLNLDHCSEVLEPTNNTTNISTINNGWKILYWEPEQRGCGQGRQARMRGWGQLLLRSWNKWKWLSAWKNGCKALLSTLRVKSNQTVGMQNTFTRCDQKLSQCNFRILRTHFATDKKIQSQFSSNTKLQFRGFYCHYDVWPSLKFESLKLYF